MTIRGVSDTYARRLCERAGAIYGVSAEDILGPCREQAITSARWAVAWVLREQGATLVDIGRALNRDHSTISHAVSLMAKRLLVDAQARDAVERVAAGEEPIGEEVTLREALADIWRQRARLDALEQRVERELIELERKRSVIRGSSRAVVVA